MSPPNALTKKIFLSDRQEEEKILLRKVDPQPEPELTPTAPMPHPVPQPPPAAAQEHRGRTHH